MFIDNQGNIFYYDIKNMFFYYFFLYLLINKTMAKKQLISPVVKFIETDKSDLTSYFSNRRGSGSSTKSTTTSGKAIVFNHFLLQENGFYILQENGSYISL